MRLPVASVVAAAAVALAANPTVHITAGTLVGGVCTNNTQASYFKSIPYAQPPVNDLRFAAPQPYTQTYTGGSRNATQAAPACIQFGDTFAEKGDSSEDCLYLDVWAPVNATNTSALPVRVWIYGGSNTAGGISDPLYDGCNVPNTAALMVSINYRLGPLGYLTLQESGIGGNQGIQDILLGLQWVQDNIVAFGGDPKKVMLHGQSAGATNSFVIASLPQASKLISSVILESGGGRDIILKDRAEALSQSYAKALNCSISNSTCLKSASVSALQSTFASLPLLNSKTLEAVGVGTIDSYDFEPYVDGNIIPVQPAMTGVNVPAIFGSASQDGALFALAQYANAPGGPRAATAQNYTTFLTENFGSAATLIERYYPLSVFNASPFPAFTAISTVLTSSSYFCSAYRGANMAVAKNIPAWVYLFSHSPTCLWLPGIPSAALPLLGATHTSEIPFMLGNTANLPQPDGNCTMSQDEQGLSAFMMYAWTAFASTQHPTANQIQWPAYGGPNNTMGIVFGNTTMANKLNFTACQLWDEIDAMEVAAANNGSYAGSYAGNGTSTRNSSTTPSGGPTMSYTPTAQAASNVPFQAAMVVFGLVIASIVLV